MLRNDPNVDSTSRTSPVAASVGAPQRRNVISTEGIFAQG